MIRASFILLTCFVLLLSSCATAEEQSKEENVQKKQSQGQVHPSLAEQANYIAFQVDGVRDVSSVVLDKELSLAVDVEQFHRFQLGSIRKKVFQALKKEHPQMKTHVSTDRKIFWELQKLQARMYDEKPDIEAIKKKMEKINKDMKG